MSTIKRITQSIAISLAIIILLASLSAAAYAEETTENRSSIIVEDIDENSVKSSTPLDNDALFESYVNEQLCLDTVKPSTRTRGSRLTGINKRIYDLLRKEIANTASGDRASTKYDISLADLGLQDKSWNAQELGVYAIVDNNAITSEANDAISEMFDLTAVINSLLYDCPYDLYWYDKVTGTHLSGARVRAFRSGSEWRIRIEEGITLSLAVSKNYSAGSYTVDTTNAERVQKAVAKAAEIVKKYKSSTDSNKLTAYRTEICSLVAYDDSVAGDSAAPYGDSWQIISVFDGDNSTNVVCEGYAKAFQYLCDMTSFSSDISCITVTGDMSGATGSGRHMWNIVNMPDGKNYLVDVTNCDDGTIGRPNLLFLIGYTRVVNGTYIFVCKGQDISYSYSDTTKKLYDISEIAICPKNTSDPSHIHTPSVLNAKAATCKEAGYSGDTICSECQEPLEWGTVIRKGSHQYEQVVKPAGLHTDGLKYDLCKVCGTTRNSTRLDGYALYYVKSPKAKGSKKALTVSWRKQSKANQKKFNGYQIRYSRDNTWRTDVRTVTAKKSAKSKKIKKLQSKTYYYVQVRSYTYANGKYFYSQWSPVKRVRTK